MPSLTIRPASAQDSRDVFAWRNDPDTRAVSLSTEEVPWSDHERWFESSLTSELRQIYICHGRVDDSELSVGMVRFDIDASSNQAEVSINLNPRARGRGLGAPTLIAAIEKFLGDFVETTALTAQIRETNGASVSIFAKAGFRKTDASEGIGRFVKEV